MPSISSVAPRVAILAAALVVAGTLSVLTFGLGNRTRACLADPEPGDLYVMRLRTLHEGRAPEVFYRLARVEDVHSDRVIVHAARERSPSKRLVHRQLMQSIAHGIAFEQADVLALPREALWDLHARGVILIARRPASTSIRGARP